MADEQKKNNKILLVEDDVFMMELLARDLRNAGFEVIVAKTGLEGVEGFEKEKPDLILLDLLLPDMGGFDALRKIRRLSDGLKARVVILSNLSEGPDQEEAKRLGVVDYLIKANYTLPEIISKIKGIIAQ